MNLKHMNEVCRLMTLLLLSIPVAHAQTKPVENIFEVYYFYASSSATDPATFLNGNTWDKSPITSVIYFTGPTFDDETGQIKPLTEKQINEWKVLKEWTSKTKRNLIYAVAGNPVKLFKYINDKAVNRKMANQVVARLKELGAQGVNIDMEYPDTQAEQNAMQQFVLNIRREIGNYTYHISVDVGPRTWMKAPEGHFNSWFSTQGASLHDDVLLSRE